MNTTNIYCLLYVILCLSLLISNSFPVYVHAVFHFVPPLEIHNLYFGKNDKGDKSYKFMLQVANFCVTRIIQRPLSTVATVATSGSVI